ncbi:MAG: DNA-directed RNA polymerase subunit A' [Candidatus Micrarchaeaceae archaeon]
MKAEAIDSIKFGIVSPEEILRMSVAKITIPDTYNDDGYPIDGGLVDQRLGVVDPGLLCKTCGARAKVCPGHFGHIELVRPVIHPEFAKIIYMLLQSTCYKCHRILLDNKQIEELKEKMKNIDKEDDSNDALKEREVAKKARSLKKCPHCGAEQPKIKFMAPTDFFIKEDAENPLRPDEIKDWLSKIPNDDLVLLGIDPYSSRPEWAVLSLLLVPPVNVRPSITLETGERSEDDLTHKLVEIIRTNQRLEQNINAGAPQLIIDDLWNLLQYHVTTYINNETSGIPAARHRSSRALKTLAQRLKGKDGRFRYNLSGKRVNFSARTVISIDNFIGIDEVGIPIEVAKTLTVPFYVTEWNMEKAKELVANKDYPRALTVVNLEGNRKRIIDANREDILKELKPGYVLERQLVDGDFVLFNRQPSLHRISIMAHKAKVLKGSKTFRINMSATAPYNADFDGDEMNLHVVQSLEAQAEAKFLMQCKDQIFSPRHGYPIISPDEDMLLGAYLITKETTKLTKNEAEYLLGVAGVYELPEPQKDGTYLGRDVLSMLIPKDFSYEDKETGLKIKNGKIVGGYLYDENFGDKSRFFVALAAKYGNEVLMDFIYRSSKMIIALITLSGVTLGVKEYRLNEKLKEERSKILNEALEKCNSYIEQYKKGELIPLHGYTLKKSLEKLILNELEIARTRASEALNKYADKESSVMLMANSGARGNILNVEQINMFLGQQATVGGSRIKRGYSTNRVLPFFEPGSEDPRHKGFVTTNFFTGLSPIDMFMHSAGARTSESEKALLTARSGYLYRRLSNALQDYYVFVDRSVRDPRNNIVQTIYGADGLNTMFSKFIEVE